MDCSLPGSSVHGIFQARVLEWVAISFSRGSSWPRDWIWVSRIAGRCFTIWTARELVEEYYFESVGNFFWGGHKESDTTERLNWTELMFVKKWKQWQILFSWDPKSLQIVTAAMKLKDTCSLEDKTWQTLDGIFKNRDIPLPTKVRAMVFPIVMYGCESWTIKRAECLRIDAFELLYWRRLLRVPWTARRTNQSILQEINPVN